MRKLLPLHGLIALMVWACQGFAQPFHSAAEYNDFIVDEQSKVIQANLAYNSELIHGQDEKKAETMRNEVIRQVQKSIQAIKNMPAFEGDTKLRDQAVTTLNLYLETYRMEFNQASILKKNREESFEAMESYLSTLEKAENKLKSASAQLTSSQKVFATKYNLNLVSNEEADNKLVEISELNAYQRKIFLTYFKPNKAQASFMDALSANNFAEMDRHRKILAKESELALTTLKGIGDFRGDDSYRTATIDLLTFYNELGTRTYPRMTEILKKEDRSQAEVDEYNDLVQKFNAGINEFVDAYNRAYDQFMRAHYPKM